MNDIGSTVVELFVDLFASLLHGLLHLGHLLDQLLVPGALRGSLRIAQLTLGLAKVVFRVLNLLLGFRTHLILLGVDSPLGYP